MLKYELYGVLLPQNLYPFSDWLDTIHHILILDETSRTLLYIFVDELPTYIENCEEILSCHFDRS